jgi:hypothetical protein
MKRRHLELLPLVFSSVDVELEILCQNLGFWKTQVLNFVLAFG